MPLNRILLSLTLAIAFPLLTGADGSETVKPAASLAEAETLFSTGVSQMKAKSWAEAVKSFRGVLELEPDLAEAHNNLGYCLRKSGAEHHDAALEHYNRALEIDPKLAAALHYRGVLHRLEGREAEAKADHQLLAALDPKLAARLLEVIATGVEPESGDGIAAW